MAERGRADEDRRRSARFLCGGDAKIIRLPSSGIVIPGMVRDLSLHGCWVDTNLPIEHGVRSEIVVRMNARMNSASFRALGEVRAIRGQSGVGLEFVQMSAGGKDLLADMVKDLARWQGFMSTLRSDRHKMDAGSLRKELQGRSFQATLLRMESAEKHGAGIVKDRLKSADLASHSDGRAGEAQPLVITVDLFV